MQMRDENYSKHVIKVVSSWGDLKQGSEFSHQCGRWNAQQASPITQRYAKVPKQTGGSFAQQFRKITFFDLHFRLSSCKIVDEIANFSVE